MKNNVVLKISLALLQVGQLIIVMYAVLLMFLIPISIFHTDIGFLEAIRLYLLNADQQGFFFFKGFDSDSFVFMSLIALKAVAIVVVWFKILGELIKVIKNLNNLKTFIQENVKAFRRITVLAVVLFFLNMLIISDGQMGLAFRLNYVFFIFGSVILTEIFKEGERLLKENKLTI